MTADAAPPESLAAIFARLIANTGPISLMHYMAVRNRSTMSNSAQGVARWRATRWRRPSVMV